MYWNMIYEETVGDWLDSLDKLQLKAIAKELKLLELCGNELKLPHSRSLGASLFELREMKFGLRIYYTFGKAQQIVLLCGGDKKTQPRDIKKAKELLKEKSKQK